jgi:hypothetical protein
MDAALAARSLTPSPTGKKRGFCGAAQAGCYRGVNCCAADVMPAE